MKVRQFEFGKDYPVVCEWWRHHGWKYLPKDRIGNALGFVCESKDKPICAVWLYLTGTSFALVEFLVTDPKAGPKTKAAAIKMVLKAALECAAQSGVTTPVTFVRQKSLVRLFENCGFKVTGEAMTEMAWRHL